MNNSIRIILFSVAVGFVCSALLAGINLITAPYRLANEKAEEVRNILDALNVFVAPGASQADLVATFDRRVKEKRLGNLPAFEYTPPGGSTIAGYAIPFTGAGLWGPVSGVIALEPDLTTIRGVRFFKQEETPGLGGEISAAWFEKQFNGKKIVSKNGKPGFSVLKPQASTGQNSVDGITGATMTSNRVETMLTNVARDVFKEKTTNGN